MESEGFYTLKGYILNNSSAMTAAMEDYLEMICRLPHDDGVRVVEIARMLHVKPSSVSKMFRLLDAAGLIKAERYGTARLTKEGEKEGAYLLRRHEIINEFFCMLNRSASELELTEKTEHCFDRRTVENLASLTEKLKSQGNTSK